MSQVTPSEVLPELAKLSSSTLLQMLVNLRYWYKYNKKADSNEPSMSAASTSLMANATPLNVSTFNGSNNLSLAPKTNSLNLKYILKNIIDWIIISGVASQKLKINLYASLLNFMHIVKGIDVKETAVEEPQSDR